jgi:hypothetical protein
MLFPNIYERRERRKLRRTKRKSKRKMYKLLHFDRLDNVDARNHLLGNASCYYEFPFLTYKNPPSNSYLEHNLIHAFQKAGFESTTHSGPRQIKNAADSIGEIPFEGIIRGLEFGNKKNIPLVISLIVLFSVGTLSFISSAVIFGMWEDWLMILFFSLAGLFFFGLIGSVILFLIWRKKMPFTATIVYWGVNQYNLKTLSDIIGPQQGFSGEIKLQDVKNIINYTSKFHPENTILHVCVAFEMKPKRFGSEDSVQG